MHTFHTASKGTMHPADSELPTLPEWGIRLYTVALNCEESNVHELSLASSFGVGRENATFTEAAFTPNNELHATKHTTTLNPDKHT